MSSIESGSSPNVTTISNEVDLPESNKLSEILPSGSNPSTTIDPNQTTITVTVASSSSSLLIRSDQLVGSIFKSSTVQSDGQRSTLADHVIKPDASPKACVRPPSTGDLTRKRSFEAEETNSDSHTTSISGCNVLKRQTPNSTVRKPPERPTTLFPPRVAAVRQVKRPNSLPIPSHVPSPKSENWDQLKEPDKTVGTSSTEGGAASTPRTIVAGRRVLQSTQTLRGSFPRTAPEAQRKSVPGSANESPWQPLASHEIGTRAPPWAPDHMTTSCMLCSTHFNLIRQRQHCRACGRIVCAVCCTRSVPVPYLSCVGTNLEQKQQQQQRPTVATYPCLRALLFCFD
ncbi:unnamed protein product [Echinostoma caproni]|uniref:FYVE-type domain-containing protein n=1 Tax=Echinostoma caproni TaxID=27848 RepID=A0A183B6W6_9TREM|nr:unnamed protein product [Echinostoma caproni]